MFTFSFFNLFFCVIRYSSRAYKNKESYLFKPLFTNGFFLLVCLFLGLPRLNQYLAEDKISCSRTQPSASVRLEYNKQMMAHCIYSGVTSYNFKNNANSVDPGEMLHNAAFQLVLHCLSFWNHYYTYTKA